MPCRTPHQVPSEYDKATPPGCFTVRFPHLTNLCYKGVGWGMKPLPLEIHPVRCKVTFETWFAFLMAVTALLITPGRTILSGDQPFPV